MIFQLSFNYLINIYIHNYIIKIVLDYKIIYILWILPLWYFTGTSTTPDVLMKKNTQTFFHESHPRQSFYRPSYHSYRHNYYHSLHKYGTGHWYTLGMQHLALTMPWLCASSRTGIWGHILVAFSRGTVSTVEEHCRKWTRNDSWLVAKTVSISVSNASL
jgi:hypothetical protein